MNYRKLPSRGRPGTRPYPLFLIAEGRPWPQEAGGFGAGTAAGRLDRLREGSSKEDTMEKIGGQHAVPKPQRAEDLGMAMADADIEQIMRRREEARERDRRRADMERETLREIDKRFELRRRRLNVGCEVAAVAAGFFLAIALYQRDINWATAAVCLYALSRMVRSEEVGDG